MSGASEEAAAARPAASAALSMVPVAAEDSGPAAGSGGRASRDARGASAGAVDGASADGGMPPVPDHVREAARSAPDHWFGMIDPAWSGAGAPPVWAMAGEWRSDSRGEVVEWRDNEQYRPSPVALGWAGPTDPVDAALQLAATGYGRADAVTRELASAEVAVFVAPGGGLLSAVSPDDESAVVPVFTSPDHLHNAGRLSFQTLRAAELLDRLPEDHVIYLNASGPVSMTVEPGMLREAVEAVGTVNEEDGWLGALDDILPVVRPETPTDGGAPVDGGTPRRSAEELS
ncbi:type VII secretion system-associated protein [Streptomyces varsoviensis]|uniref:type VII secretion system-associated protein n=1 Tax=Streptomyces varsoviensis TaxID=67373 RepID=UPI00068DFB10|nr:type VII secretion system-associated protein [Streptomyces varsoviensis]